MRRNIFCFLLMFLFVLILQNPSFASGVGDSDPDPAPPPSYPTSCTSDSISHCTLVTSGQGYCCTGSSYAVYSTPTTFAGICCCYRTYDPCKSASSCLWDGCTGYDPYTCSCTNCTAAQCTGTYIP